MPTLTVKKIPPAVYEALREQALRHHRSINGEIISILEENVLAKEVNPEEVLEQAAEYRRLTASRPLTDDEITRAMEEDRR